MAGFLLDVETKQLSRALGRVAAAADKTLELIHLKYNWGLLRIAAAGTAVDLKAVGSWPDVVSIERTAALALKQYLPDTAVTSLRVENGKLYARDFGLACDCDSTTRNQPRTPSWLFSANCHPSFDGRIVSTFESDH